MDTYGDMVTLLLAFFVLLFSFSTIDAAKWEALIGSLTGTGTSTIQTLDVQQVVQAPIQLEINTQLTQNPNNPNTPMSGNSQQEIETFRELVQAVGSFIEGNGLNVELIPEEQTLTLTMRVEDSVFFDSGSAVIRSDSYGLLDSLSLLFFDVAGLVEQIEIFGHTDSDPISTAQFQDNLALSSARANEALRYLMAATPDIPETLWESSGLSEWHPIDDNETESGKARNRRVEFVIHSRTDEFLRELNLVD